MSNTSRTTRKKLLLSLAALSGIGLAGILLLRAKSMTPAMKNAAKVINGILNTPYKHLAKYILAQSQVETGNFTSLLFRQYNNAFGMKNPLVRPSVGYDDPNTQFRAYDSIDQSVEDLVLWMDYVNFPQYVQDVESYVREMKLRGYFEENESDYLRAMRSWL